LVVIHLRQAKQAIVVIRAGDGQVDRDALHGHRTGAPGMCTSVWYTGTSMTM